MLGSDFALSQNPHMRKGGLIGLAAMAIGLGILIIKNVSSSTSHKNSVYPHSVPLQIRG